MQSAVHNKCCLHGKPHKGTCPAHKTPVVRAALQPRAETGHLSRLSSLRNSLHLRLGGEARQVDEDADSAASPLCYRRHRRAGWTIRGAAAASGMPT